MLFSVSQTIGATDELNVKKYQCLDSRCDVRMEKVGEVETNACQVGVQVTVEIPNLESWMEADSTKRKYENLFLVQSHFTTLNMPEFDASLMGPSSGTYVGFEIPGTAGKQADTPI